jgi:hypothetical protein
MPTASQDDEYLKILDDVASLWEIPDPSRRFWLGRQLSYGDGILTAGSFFCAMASGMANDQETAFSFGAAAIVASVLQAVAHVGAIHCLQKQEREIFDRNIIEAPGKAYSSFFRTIAGNSAKIASLVSFPPAVQVPMAWIGQGVDVATSMYDIAAETTEAVKTLRRSGWNFRDDVSLIRKMTAAGAPFAFGMASFLTGLFCEEGNARAGLMTAGAISMDMGLFGVGSDIKEYLKEKAGQGGGVYETVQGYGTFASPGAADAEIALSPMSRNGGNDGNAPEVAKLGVWSTAAMFTGGTPGYIATFGEYLPGKQEMAIAANIAYTVCKTAMSVIKPSSYIENARKRLEWSETAGSSR